MTNLTELQKQIYSNKVEKGFNTTDIYMEFCFAHSELTEAFEAYRKKQDTVGEELADAAIYLLGIAEILGVDLESEISSKIAVNKNRRYEQVDGVLRRVAESWENDAHK